MRILVCLLMLITTVCHAQVDKVYMTEDVFYGKSKLRLNADNTYSYYSTGCSGSAYGSGKYIRIYNTVYLTSYQSSFPPFKIKLSYNPANKDSVKLDMKARLVVYSIIVNNTIIAFEEKGINSKAISSFPRNIVSKMTIFYWPTGWEYTNKLRSITISPDKYNVIEVVAEEYSSYVGPQKVWRIMNNRLVDVKHGLEIMTDSLAMTDVW